MLAARMKRGRDSADVTVFEDELVAFSCSADHNIDHCIRQIVGANHLIGKQNSKRRVGPAQQSIAEIRFLPWLPWVDVCGPEDVNPWDPVASNAFSASPLIRAKRIRLRSVGSAPLPLRKENPASGLLS